MKAFDIDQLPTPALLVDLVTMEKNLHTMASFFKDRPCALRPHFKNHKCIELANKQIAAGAIGITSATLSETETLVKAGIRSILVANEIAGEANLKKLIELVADTEILLAVDNEKVVNDIARLSRGKKSNLGLVVDIDLGLKRCGVQPGLPALQLAEKIINKQLKFSGLMGYEGHLQRLDPGNDSLVVRKEALQQLVTTKNMLVGSGIPVDIVSAGGTGTYTIAGDTKGITEVQAGNYLLMDTSYAPFAPDFQPSLSVLTTVISVTPGERFIINTGIKEISAERGMPSLKNFKGAVLQTLHAEHGIVEIQDRALTVEVGDNIELPVYYSDGTVNLHNIIYGVRDRKVETVFEISKIIFEI